MSKGLTIEEAKKYMTTIHPEEHLEFLKTLPSKKVKSDPLTQARKASLANPPKVFTKPHGGRSRRRKTRRRKTRR
jgi:hypothetical protein